MRPSEPAGFTLAELLIAVLLGAMVLSCAAAFHQFAVTRQMAMMERLRLDGQALFALEAVNGTLRNASQVLVPPQGSSAISLTVYENVSPEDGEAIVRSRPRRWTHICLAPVPPAGLYRYSGELPVPAIACGQPSPGIDVELLAGEPARPAEVAMRVGALFSRVAGAGNIVVYQYGLDYPARAGAPPGWSRGVARVHLEGSLP